MFGENRSKTMRVPLKLRSAFAFVDEAPASVPDSSQNELASQYHTLPPLVLHSLLGDDLKNEA